MKVVSTSIICTFILFITCIQTSIGANSMDECTLFVGGDFISSSNAANSTEISTSFLKYDLGSETFSSSYGPGVYSNSYMNNLFYFNNNLFFAGDITRVQFENSVNLGSYDFNSKALKGANQGIWTQSNILPTLDSSYSPSLLFAAYGTSTNLIIAGRFDSHEEIQKIALYDTVSNVYSQFPLSGVDWTSKTVISLLSTSTSVFIATMNEADLSTNLYVFMDDIWSPISSPTYTTAGSTEELKIMFDSLTISGESLFTVAYQSSNSLLSAPSVSFYLVSWSLQDLTAEPAVTMVYQKTCSASSSSSTTDSDYTTNNNIVYPKIVPYRNQTILVALPTGSCPVSASDVRFAIYSDTLTLKTDELGGIATLSHFKTPRHFVTNSNYDLFLSNGDALYGMKNSGSNGTWSSILKTDNTPIVSVTWSDAHQELYLGYVSQGVVHVDHCTISSKTTRWSLFSDGIYTAGKINTVVELANSNILIGGDFQYVGAAFVSARFAALWNGATWVPTLKGNALPGAKLLAAQALGNVVYAFANPGDTVVGNLPVMHWTADSGWTYLPTRPTLYSFDNTTAPIWDRTAATVYIDHTNRTVYFGGNFTVRYDAKQPVASGVIIYNIAKERWSTLPANLTNVHAVGSLSSHSLLQIGGKFTFVDKYATAVTYENYVLYDPIAQRFLPDVPVSPATEVFAVAPFPGQSKYSFVGGNFGTQGVEQLRNVANVWSWSVVGNSPLSATVYSLTSRNEGTVLFAGGSFANGLAKFDIPTLVWSSLIPAEFSWKGTVKSVTLHCPFDDLYYSDKSDWDNTSHLEGLTSNDYHHNEQQPLTGWKIFGLAVAVLVTVSIVGAIGFYAFKMYKSHSAAAPVEYI